MGYDTEAATEAGHSIDDQLNYLAKLHHYDTAAAEASGFSKEDQVKYLAGLTEQKPTATAKEPEGNGIPMAPAGAVIGAATGPMTAPVVSNLVDAGVTGVAKIMAPHPDTLTRMLTGAPESNAPQAVQKWLKTQTSNPFAGGKDMESAFEKSQRAAGKPIQSRGSDIPIRKGRLGIANQLPEQTALQKGASSILNAERVPTPGMLRRVVGMGATGAQAGNLIEELEKGNYGRAALSGLGTLAGAATQSRIKPVRAIGTGLSAAIPAIQYMLPEEQEVQQKADGGSIRKVLKHVPGAALVGGLTFPDIAEAADQIRHGKFGEGFGNLAGTAANFLPGPLGIASMALSPSELGDATLYKHQTGPYEEGQTNILKGSYLEPKKYAPGGKVVDLLTKALEPISKSGMQLKREAAYAHDILPTHNFSSPNKLSIQDLQGGILVGVPGDRTLTGHSLMSVNGVPLSSPVALHGGPRYGQRKADLGENAFWASEKGAASGLQNKAANAAEIAKGNPVFGMYAAMAPDASNYALHHTEALVNQLDALNPNKAKLRAFDNMIRDSYPEFLGMNHPEVMNQFASNSDLRKHVADRLNKSTIANEFGMPSGEATIHAITEPELRNVKTGTAGYSVGELNPGAELKPELEHPTYNTQIPGSFKGQMIAQLPWEYYFPDVAKQIAQNPKQAPHAWGTFKMGDFNQPVTQELVDKIAPIEEMVKSATKDFAQ
jgi:hypothetical protein